MIVRLIEKHRKGCRAVELYEKGEWDTPWYVPREVQTLWRDSIGRKSKHRRHRFLLLRCNSTNHCPAELLVSENCIEVEAQKALAPPPGPRGDRA